MRKLSMSYGIFVILIFIGLLTMNFFSQLILRLFSQSISVGQELLFLLTLILFSVVVFFGMFNPSMYSLQGTVLWFSVIIYLYSKEAITLFGYLHYLPYGSIELLFYLCTITISFICIGYLILNRKAIIYDKKSRYSKNKKNRKKSREENKAELLFLRLILFVVGLTFIISCFLVIFKPFNIDNQEILEEISLSLYDLNISESISFCKQHYYRDACFLYLTYTTFNESNTFLCEYLSTPQEVEECYSTYAFTFNNSEHCKSILDNSSQSYCLALSTKNASYCESIEDDKEMRRCFNTLGFILITDEDLNSSDNITIEIPRT